MLAIEPIIVTADASSEAEIDVVAFLLLGSQVGRIQHGLRCTRSSARAGQKVQQILASFFQEVELSAIEVST